MADDGETEQGGQTTDKRPPKPAPTEENKGQAHAHKDEPCCCWLRFTCKSIEVARATDADLPVVGEVPLIGKLFGAIDDTDKVAMVWRDCSGVPHIYPIDGGAVPIDKGPAPGKPVNRVLVDVVPKQGCLIDCEVTISVYKITSLSDLLNGLASLLPQLGEAAVAGVKDASGLGPLINAGEQALGKATGTGKSGSGSGKDSLDNDAKLLAKLYAKTGVHMHEYSFQFFGRSDCGKTDALKNLLSRNGGTGTGVNISYPSDSTANIDWTIDAAGGQWIIHLEVEKICDVPAPKGMKQGAKGPTPK